MIRSAILVNLVAYSIVVSQPLAYLLFLGQAQRALSAAAYIELRQRINPVMIRRLPVVYLSTLATGLLLLVLSWRMGDWVGSVTAACGILCLVIDLLLMTRANVPINSVIDQWSTTQYPEDWERYRAQWLGVFTYRQVVLLVGFFSLLLGASIQS